jgi:AraC-like DNA-binding protein
MLFHFGFYSSLLLIFFVHGLVYAIMLYRKGLKNETVADKWLAVFLLLCVLYICPWMLGFAGWYDNQPYRDGLFYIPFQHLYLLGPVVFFYVQSLLNPNFSFAKKQWLHLIPGMLYLLYSGVVVVTDKLVLRKYFFLASEQDPDFESWYQLSGFFSMAVYFLLSLRYYHMYRRLMVQVISYADVVMFKWVKNFMWAFLLMLLLRLVFYMAAFIPAFEAMRYTGPWWEYFSFALIFYYIAITGYANAIQARVPFKLNLLQQPAMWLLPAASPELATKDAWFEEAEIVTEPAAAAAVAAPADTALIDEWKPRILKLIAEDKAYQDPELSLAQMAKTLKTNPSLISKIINQGFRQNFNDFVNHYRIVAVQQMLKDGEQQTQTLLGIAYDCGFNSKATFNRAFKKATSISPKEWIDQHHINA